MFNILPPFSRLFGSSNKEDLKETEAYNPDEVMHISLDDITPNRYQPRTIFDEGKIKELAQTIQTHGIIQPIVVREISDGDGKFEIIAGERRYRAVTSLGWDSIPSIVRQMNDKEMASVALIENLQREELTPIEEAQAYDRLLKIHELTQEALAQRLGKSQSTIANKLRLLKLPEPVQMAILNKKITERHARTLIILKDEKKQVDMMNEIIENDLNVKQTEERINNLISKTPKKRKPRMKGFNRDTRIAMNTIRESLNMITKTGIKLDTEEIDLEDYYQITIKIPKK